jgi:hypothetical protein
MDARERRGVVPSVRLAVRLHDVSGDLAVGIALLKGWKEAGWGEKKPGPTFQPPAVNARLEAKSRAWLRAILASQYGPTNLRESLEREASGAGVDLQLSLTESKGKFFREKIQDRYLVVLRGQV